jgi:hypothetical protein
MKKVYNKKLNKSEKFNIPFLETSALCGENISKVFEELIQKVYINNKEELVEHNKKEIKKGVDLNEIKNENNTAEKSEKKGCCS